jgi:rfaE bifunctional protein nucleotidyltransferase chain/domain
MDDLKRRDISEGELLEALAPLREEGKKVVFTNGCFDIIHKGHVVYLEKARALGDVLVVGLNSDGSTRRLKGDGRPVNPEGDRAWVLSGLRAVDHVVVFGEDTPQELMSRLRPDIHVKGGDYTEDQLPEAPLVRSYGGEIVIMPFVEGRSTTGVIEKAASGSRRES